MPRLRRRLGLGAYNSAALTDDDADPGHHEFARRVVELQYAAGREQQRVAPVQDGQGSFAAGAEDEGPVANAPLLWLSASWMRLS